MKLIRKYDVFKELSKYAEGKLSIGECVDNCQTYEVDEMIAEIHKVLHGLTILIAVKNYNKDDLTDYVEKLQEIINTLKEWGCEE